MVSIANNSNNISKELTKERQKRQRSSALLYEGLHQEYITHPKAQFVMSFVEYKKLRRNQRKFAAWIINNPRQ